MSGCVADKKRLITVTEGNLRNHHFYLSGHYDFFPDDCIGASAKQAKGREIEISLVGLNKTVRTDIGRESGSGKPRRFFRGRKWVREFYAHHGIKTGDVLAIERTAARSYRLYPFQAKKNRDDSWRSAKGPPREVSVPPRAAEF